MVALFLLNTNLSALDYRNEIFFCSPEKFLSQIKKPDKSSSIHAAAKTYGDVINSWIFDKTVNNVDFFHKITECNGSSAVFLKFENKNKVKVRVSWKELFISSQVNSKTEGFHGKKQLVLSPGETSPSNCGETQFKECLILAEQALPHYKAVITKFEFKDILVTTFK